MAPKSRKPYFQGSDIIGQIFQEAGGRSRRCHGVPTPPKQPDTQHKSSTAITERLKPANTENKRDASTPTSAQRCSDSSMTVLRSSKTLPPKAPSSNWYAFAERRMWRLYEVMSTDYYFYGATKSIHPVKIIFSWVFDTMP